MNLPIYLDFNASTPVDERVLAAMLPWFRDQFANPASDHPPGKAAAAAVNHAREQIARLIHARPEEIHFTSGATESCNLAIRGLAEHYAPRGRHIVTTAHEHLAALDPCRRLHRLGQSVTFLRPNTAGIVTAAEVEPALRDDTALVSIHWANNETGAINDIPAIAALCRSRNIRFHTDATQYLGRLPIDVEAMGIDVISASAHKLYGPKGVGLLFVRSHDPRVRLMPQIEGGGQEGGLRSGTLNVPAIVGFGQAGEIAQLHMADDATRLGALRDHLREGLQSGLGDRIRVNSPPDSLPNTLNISITGDHPAEVIKAIPDLAVASASACHTGSAQPSHVLKAMGLSDDVAFAAIRFSLGRPTTREEIDHAISHVIDAFRR